MYQLLFWALRIQRGIRPGLFLKDITAHWKEVIVTKIQHERFHYIDMCRALSEHGTRKSKQGCLVRKGPQLQII